MIIVILPYEKCDTQIDEQTEAEGLTDEQHKSVKHRKGISLCMQITK